MIEELQAIDVHGHYGRWVQDEARSHMGECISGGAETVVARAKLARIEWTVVSPLLGLMPRGKADSEEGNQEANRVVDETEGLLQWVIVNPRQPKTYDQARERLSSPKCMGIKIHPEENDYHIREHGEALFAFAAEHKAVVLTHSGNANSPPADFLPFADAHPEVTLILAHIGNSDGDDLRDQIRAVEASRLGNVYADTSSMRSMFSGLIEWAVKTVGSEQILFGTDTPLYFSSAQRARIDHAEISEEDKCRILRGNAERILSLPSTNNEQQITNNQ